MEFNIETRKKQLDNLDQFIGSSRDQVESILEFLGWDSHKIAEKQKEMIMCRVNSSHRIPAASAVKHMQTCAWRKESYKDGEKSLSEPNHIPGSTIIMDNMMKVNILNAALAKNPQMRTGWRSHEPPPRTSDRLFSSFTPDERLALYNYAVASTKGPPQVPEFNITKPKEEEKHDMTLEEVRAMERDAKRRRIKYKSKCVHTNKKSATEIIREVIEVQMEEYEDYLKHETNPNLSCDDEAESSTLHMDTFSPHSPKSQTSYRSQDSRQLSSYQRSTSREQMREESIRGSNDRSIERSDNYLIDHSDRLSRERDLSRNESLERSRYRSRDPSRERIIEQTTHRSSSRSRYNSRERSRGSSKQRSFEESRTRYRKNSRERSRSRNRRYDQDNYDYRQNYRDDYHSSRRKYHDRNHEQRSDSHRRRSREFSSGSSHSRYRDRYDH